MASKKSAAIVGSGPAGLMAADVLASCGVDVVVFEKRKSAGWKLLVAGSSGLNITYDAPHGEFASFYRDDGGRMRGQLEAFTPERWRRFIEHELGQETFVGTSHRLFVHEMKASGLLKSWTARLQGLGVRFEFDRKLTDFESLPEGVRLRFAGETPQRFDDGKPQRFDAAVLALGGASHEPAPPGWPAVLIHRGVSLTPFRASNVGYEVAWTPELGARLDGEPVKNVVLKTTLGEKRGDLMLKSWGIEGTPVYHVGTTGPATIDLKPDLSLPRLLASLAAVKENLSPFRRVKKKLKLSEAALTLIRQLTPEPVLADLSALAARLKAFPLELKGPRPLSEAISSAGGVAFDELDATLMLKRHPGVFCAGEMIDWDAPTGGFLIQGCVSQGFVAARGALAHLAARR